MTMNQTVRFCAVLTLIHFYNITPQGINAISEGKTLQQTGLQIIFLCRRGMTVQPNHYISVQKTRNVVGHAYVDI